MALRVLLADESTTIKKVMQLALQDFAVEVKAVHAGVDVVEVARAFQPDIIFADVLLQKKNGYEVCADLKNDAGLRSTPVVLMWSSFMDLDEKLASQCGANNRLEKPFDVESLRQLVLQLVPKTQTQRLAHFLNFPGTFTEPLKAEEARKQEAIVPPPVATAPAPVAAREAAPAPATPSTQAIAMPPPAPPKPTASEAIPMPPPVQSAPPAANRPPAPPPPERAQPAGSSWNMESFADIGEFEEKEPETSAPEAHEMSMPEMESPEFELEADADDSDEGFTEFKLTNLSASRQPAATRLTEQTAQSLFQSGTNESSGEDEDPWSHQDLSRFKLDLPPVSVDTEDFSVDLDVSENELAGTDFLLRTNPPPSQQLAPRAQMAPPAARHEPPALEPESFDSNRTFELEDDSGPSFFQEPSPLNEVSLEEVPMEGPEFAYSNEIGSRFGVGDDHLNEQAAFAPIQPKPTYSPAGNESLSSGEIPRLNAEQLEEIIRAQSKEIIESVVRRIVPDIASTLIKQELQRLLEDTAVTQRTDRETRR